MKLSEYVRNKRIKSGLTQSQLADKLGVTKATVSNIERGHHAGRETLWKIAGEFQVAISVLAELNESDK